MFYYNDESPFAISKQEFRQLLKQNNRLIRDIEALTELLNNYYTREEINQKMEDLENQNSDS